MTSPKLALITVPADTRTILYTRVSSDEQRDKAVSPAEQARVCRAFATELGRTEHVYLWDHDLGVSGRDWSRLERLAAWCEAHPRPKTARGLIVALKRDRWARFTHSAKASTAFEYRMEQAGWDVNFALERTTGNRDADRVLAVVHEGQATSESEEKGRRARMGREALAKAGGWAGRPPFGYDRVTASDRVLAVGEHAGKGDAVTLRPNADAPTVKRIFARFAAGASLPTIAAELNTVRVRGPWVLYPNPGGSARWRACTLRVLLANPAYRGETVAMRRVNTGEKKPGTRTEKMQDVRVVQDRAAWVTKRETHPALISADTFATAQGRLHPLTGQHRQRNADWLLSGLLTCAECGGPLVGGGGTGANRFYRCQGAADDKHATPRCTAPRLTVNKQLVERTVLTQVADRVAQLVASGALARTLDTLLDVQGNTAGDRLGLERTVRDVRARIAKLVDRAETSDDESITERLTERRAELRDLERQLATEAARPTTVALKAERARLLALAADFPARIRTANPVEARALLAFWLAGAVVHKAAHKGGNLPVALTLRTVPAELGQLAPASLASQGSRGITKLVTVARLELPRRNGGAHRRQA